MVRNRLAQDDVAAGFLLDGYPRNPEQAVELEGMLADDGTALDAVVEITADSSEVTSRLLKRAEIEGRADDTEDVIRKRLEVYAESTAPVTAYYEGRGLLVRVDGMGEVDAVTQRMVDALRAR
jgi:adenylate kinase